MTSSHVEPDLPRHVGVCDPPISAVLDLDWQYRSSPKSRLVASRSSCQTLSPPRPRRRTHRQSPAQATKSLAISESRVFATQLLHAFMLSAGRHPEHEPRNGCNVTRSESTDDSAWSLGLRRRCLGAFLSPGPPANHGTVKLCLQRSESFVCRSTPSVWAIAQHSLQPAWPFSEAWAKRAKDACQKREHLHWSRKSMRDQGHDASDNFRRERRNFL